MKIDSIYWTSKFKSDYKKSKKRNENIKELKIVIEKLFNKEPLETKYRDHILLGDKNGLRELHLHPNWLLIYKYENHNLILIRMGSHNDLFNM